VRSASNVWRGCQGGCVCRALACLVGLCLASPAACAGGERESSAPQGPAPQVSTPRATAEATTTEQVSCAEVQVMPRMAGGSTVRRYRAKPGGTLQLSRSAAAYALTAPAGSSLGKTDPTNGYVPEQRHELHEEHTATFETSSYVVHCLTEPADPPAP
jgi:hypothetical protein